jgi:hypothetical protein
MPLLEGKVAMVTGGAIVKTASIAAFVGERGFPEHATSTGGVSTQRTRRPSNRPAQACPSTPSVPAPCAHR